MITVGIFHGLLNMLDRLGVAQADIDWAESREIPTTATVFASETIFVICNSGMKNTVARRIYDRIIPALQAGLSSSSVFGHKGKTAAIDRIWNERERFYAEYLGAADKVAYCETIPFIGAITKFHLAKNFGAQVAKPDVHLKRLADREQCTSQELCERLSRETGYKVSTVDTLLWRACALGVLNSRTGELIQERL